MSSAEFTEDIKPAYFWDGFNWVKINDPLSTYENIVSASAAAYSSASAYTDSASASIVDYIDNLTTTDIEEGSNLYFTEERSLNTASSALVHDNHSNIIATYDSASYEIILTGTSSGGASVIYTEEQPDITELPVGTIWVDSDAEIVSGGSGGIGLNNWTENENGDLIPNVANIQSIGSSAFPVKEIYVSGSTIYLGETTLSVEDGELNISGSKVITESNANENLDLTNYLTLSTASSTYATKTELDEIDLTETINTASAAAYASASAYVDQEISALIGGAPETLDTLNEIASALEDNPEVLDLFLTKQEFAGASASFYRWTKTYSGSATVISGVDDNLITLEYDEGYEQVFINGVMIEPSEYTRTSASVITLDEAVQASDVVDIFAYRNAFSTNTYTQAQIDAKYNSFSRWQKIYSASASVITGEDDNSLSLSYTPGFEQVYLNGILLTKDEDYTATNSSTVTLNQAIAINDVIEILSFQPFNIADTYTQTEADNKFLTQSSASTTYLTESSASATYLNKESGYLYKETVYFTSSGTFTKASYPWLKAIKIKLIGGGGSGGGAKTTTSTQGSLGCGGGAGGYAERFFTDISSLDSSVTVTVGSGGTGVSADAGNSGGNSEFGGSGDAWRTHASGGSGGNIFGPSGAPDSRGGASSGSGLDGDFLSPGSPGEGSFLLAISGFRAVSGNGGSSIYAGGGIGVNTNINTGSNGNAGSIGSGGSGAENLGTSGTARSGGNGGNGIVIMELYA